MVPYTHDMFIEKATTAIAPSGDNTGNVAANHYYVKFDVDTAGYANSGDHY